MDQFIGEIRAFAGLKPPSGWVFCNGQLLQISAYQALFSLLGTTYGGDGSTTFGVPNITGSAIIGIGQAPDVATTIYQLADVGGVDQVTLTEAQVPAHTHQMTATTNQATSATPSTTLGFASVSGQNLLAYTDMTNGAKPNTPAIEYGTDAVSGEGSTAPHGNLMPSVALNYIIALQGVFPQAS